MNTLGGVQSGSPYPAFSASSNTDHRVRRWTTFLLIAAIAVVYFGTIRDGQAWGDDFALFILHARNIALGLPYSDTAYLYNPDSADIGPGTAPPVFPFLLAPVYRFAGLNLRAMKMEEIVFLLLALFCISLLLCYFLPFPYVAAILVVLGLNPLSLHMKEQILTDVPFFLFCYVVVYLVTRAEVSGESSRYLWLPLSLLIYVAYGTRILGILLLVALVVSYLISRRLPLRTVILTTLATSLLAGVQTVLLQGMVISYKDDVTRVKGLGFTPEHLLINLTALQWEVRNHIWPAGNSRALSWAFFGFLLLLGGRGLYIRVRRGVSYLDIFALVYLPAAVMLPPSEDPRYIYPLLPVWMFYICVALSGIERRRLRIATIALTLALVMFSYSTAYRGADFGPIRQGIGDPGFQSVCAYLKEHATDKGVFIFLKPRLLGLMTGHPTAAVSPEGSFDEKKAYLAKIGAQFVVTTHDFPEDQEHWARFADANTGSLRKVLDNRGFVIYQAGPQTDRLK